MRSAATGCNGKLFGNLLTFRGVYEKISPIAPDPLVLAKSGITFGPSRFWDMESAGANPSKTISYLF